MKVAGRLGSWKHSAAARASTASAITNASRGNPTARKAARTTRTLLPGLGRVNGGDCRGLSRGHDVAPGGRKTFGHGSAILNESKVLD